MCVHSRHCCAQHGCKYGDKDCPVVLNLVKQEYLCDECWKGREYYWLHDEQDESQFSDYDEQDHW